MIRKIGILGGSFDPVHIGHLIIAEGIADRLGLASVLFIPCHTPPHKNAANLSAGEHRRRMVELAVEGNPRFQACDVELSRGGISYSVDTVAELQAQHERETEFYFIVGADSITELATWRECKKLLTLCTVVTAVRPGWNLSSWQPHEGIYTPEEIAALKGHIMETPLIGVSSTEIRRRRQRGESIRYLVPADVEEYIVNNNLYVLREGEGRECETAKGKCEKVR
jgi:nicotinate-nucleotide adenylyltransferase